MSNDVKETKSEAENKELDDLLDSALEDFDKLSMVDNATGTTKHDNIPAKSDSQEQTDKCETTENTEKEWTEEFIKQTIDQMDKNLQNVLQNGGGDFDELRSILQKLGQASDSNAASGEDNINTDIESAISQALKALSVPTENVQNDADYMAAMLGETSLDGDGSDILSFVQGMMQQLLSKEMLYPSLKEISDKYPAWLEEHKATLSPSDLQKYTQQSELLRKVCTELEKEKEDDAQDVKQRRFESIMTLMQEMEKFGRLPVELASTLLRPDSFGEGSFLDEFNSILCENV